MSETGVNEEAQEIIKRDSYKPSSPVDEYEEDFEEEEATTVAPSEIPPEIIYGGCEGPEAEYVKLISCDGYEFIVRRVHALISGTIKAMLSGPSQFTENEVNEIVFRELPAYVLYKVCTYFGYKSCFGSLPGEVPDFPIVPEIALELLMAANFLDC